MGGALNSIAAVQATLSIAGNANASVDLAGTGEKSLTSQYYHSILGRAPDAAGSAFWNAEAARIVGLGGNVNEAWFAMAQAFFFSTEYAALNRADFQFVEDLYRTFFNRAPDSDGQGFWTNQLSQGTPREVLLAAFMFSTEFRNFAQGIFGNTAVRAEVDAVMDFYRGLLARLPDNGGFAFWVKRFRDAQCLGPTAVTTQADAISGEFLGSAEYLARNRSNARYVGDLYNAFLRRGGDNPGVLFWINQLGSGVQTREQVRAQFRDSPEFKARVSAMAALSCLP